jgi:hypothetical protein
VATQTPTRIEELEQRVQEIEAERSELRGALEQLAIDYHHEHHHTAVFTDCSRKPCSDIVELLGRQH